MSSVTQAPATRERLNELIAELYGDQPAPLSTAGERWPQAVAQVEEQLRAKLRVEVLPERMRKALDLVRADAVTLHADGTASVQSGKQTYTLSPECTCGDAKNRTELCKHSLAVELHRRALALLDGTAPAPPTPAGPPSGQVLARGHTRPTRGTYADHLTRLREGVPCSAPVLDRAAVAAFHFPTYADPRGTAAPGVVRGRAPNSLQSWLATRQSRSWQPGQLPWPFRWTR